jgi:acetyltransferase-like isoleucine patch superfamily enzyme
MGRKIKLLFLFLLAFLPSFLKCPLYRLFLGYKIGSNVKIGFSIIDVEKCEIQDDVRIGHLNLLTSTKQLFIGDHTRIGHLNIIRGGDEVRIGRYAEILRLNEINSILNPLVSNKIDPRFLLGDGSVITTSHKIDFTDKVEIGKRVILGGRNSSLWTHNRQQTMPITIGDYSYIGSEIRIVPGGEIPPKCVVGIASVITKKFIEESSLIAGVPAKVVKELGEEGQSLVSFKTRPDLPEDI